MSFPSGPAATEVSALRPPAPPLRPSSISRNPLLIFSRIAFRNSGPPYIGLDPLSPFGKNVIGSNNVTFANEMATGLAPEVGFVEGSSDIEVIKTVRGRGSCSSGAPQLIPCSPFFSATLPRPTTTCSRSCRLRASTPLSSLESALRQCCPLMSSWRWRSDKRPPTCPQRRDPLHLVRPL